MENQNVDNNQCDTVELVDKKTGLKKVAYLCKKPFVKRAQHYKENSLHFWTDLGLIGTIIILIGVIVTLWLFNVLKHTNLVDFKVDYNVEELVNGQRIDFIVNYQNTSDKVVTNAEVIVRFPDGLQDVAIVDTRYDSNTQALSIGTLEPQQSGNFAVTGLLLSDLGNAEKFVFVLNYFNDLGQPQQEFTAREFVVENSIVSLSLSLPDKIIIGSQFPSQISITNKADYVYSGLKLVLQYPETYKTEAGTVVSLESLNPGETEIKELLGSIGQASPGIHAFQITILQEFNGNDFVLSKTSTSTLVDFSKFVLRFVNTDNNKAIKPGEQTITTLRLENNELFDITDLALTFTVTGDFTDKNFLDNTYPLQTKDSTVFWPKEKLFDLSTKEQREISFTVAALPFIFVNNENQGKQDLQIIANASFVPANNPDSKIFVSSQPISIPITSKLAIKSFGLFYTDTGDQIGVGSIPPTPGEYTAYWAILRLTNGVNKLRNVKVTGDIAPGVAFTEQYNVTMGSPIRAYQNKTKLEWYLSEMDAYAGIVGPSPEARILLSIVPSDNDIGKIMPLLSNITVSGIDNRTGEIITTSGSNITTAVFDQAFQNKVSN